MIRREEGLVSPSDIADIAGVSRGAVSNWRKRIKTFPEPVAGSPNNPLFSRRAVTDWLESHARKTKNESLRKRTPESEGMDVWAALNVLREQLSAEDATDLVLALAVARKTGAAAQIDFAAGDAEPYAPLRHTLDRVAVSDLGAVVDFTLERLARSQGKLGANFGFVGSRTTVMLASLAASHQGGVLYDPACGIAAALLAAVTFGAHPDRIIGHDINARALRVAAQRAELYDVDIELVQTDVLSEDVDPLLQADVIVLEPPFSVRMDTSARLTDTRFDFGAPPRSSADTAWLQHAVAHLTGPGRAYVLSPAGTLFRAGDEGKIRTELLRRGCVETVVGLPGKLLPHMSVPLALWVLRHPSAHAATNDVLLIDASETVAPERQITAWLSDSIARETVPYIEIPITDVLAAESILTPRRWIDRTEREPRDVASAYVTGWAAIKDNTQKLQSVLSSFEDFANYSRSRVMTVGELVDQGVLEVRLGRPKDRLKDLPEELRARIATASDIRDGTLRKISFGVEYDDYPELTREEDVLVTTMNTIRARVDDVGGHLPSTGVYRLRVNDHDLISPAYLAIALMGSWNKAFQYGTTIKRAPVKLLEVPLLPKSEQLDIQRSVHSIRLLHDQAANIADAAKDVGNALLDALRYNASLANSVTSIKGSDHDDRKKSEGTK